MRNDKENSIVNKTFDFALNIIEFSEELYKINRFSLANQIFKSRTSIGANVREAQNAESKADFIHKIKIAAKEADETERWLLLC
ncbi:four helix bundle protein [Chryseobacterium sp. PMSZPI]|uniref:four helix bundle protein n=1 Tax=Chryseobacterium sp. PMSZPI TaxID=1033900 RepID=UPI002685F131|nr:four helix bundle protein [Chryseobacterium sp. PMSZPI]